MRSGTEYLRAIEIARLTGMSVRTVRRWIKDEVLPSVKIGGARLVAKADLQGALFVPHDALQEASDDAGQCDDISEQ